jgi:hypothetical protein
MSNKNTQYALIEQGSIHTDWLSLEDAKEMLERHSSFFPGINWAIVPMSEVEDKERLKGYLERQREIAVKYRSV